MRSAVLVLVVAAALGAAGPATASPGVRYGIQDDAWLAQGAGTLEERLDTLERLGVDLVRLTVRWDEVEAIEGELDWTMPDAVLRGLRARGIAPLVTLYGTPAWANGGRRPNVPPSRGADFAAFAAAAAVRYRWVRLWTVWNEPNQRRWLRPASPELYVVRLLNPAYEAIERVNPYARVAGGVTAPRGNVGGVSPVDWIRRMGRAGARLDAYAHHPYPTNRFETPWSGGCGHCETITMATLERLLREVGRAFGPKPIWLTEFGYQSNPPDRLIGVNPALQARYIGEAALRAYLAPRVEILVHYLYRDEPDLGRFQSGLVTTAGRPKPAASAFPFPLAQRLRRGAVAELWGQVRPRPGAQPFRLQLLRAGRAAWVGGIRTTSARGTFRLRLRLPRGALVRIWSPRDRAFGAAILIR